MPSLPQSLSPGGPLNSLKREASGSGYGPNGAETRYCSVPSRWRICGMVNARGDEASTLAEERFPKETLLDGRGDAFRHCTWAAFITLDLGADKAKEFTNRHEEGEDHDAKDVQMDLSNNATGIEVGKSSSSKDEAANKCEKLANDNKLVRLK